MLRNVMMMRKMNEITYLLLKGHAGICMLHEDFWLLENDQGCLQCGSIP